MPATPITIAGAKYAWEIVPPGGSVRTVKLWKLCPRTGRTLGYYYLRAWRGGVQTCTCESFEHRTFCKHIDNCAHLLQENPCPQP